MKKNPSINTKPHIKRSSPKSRVFSVNLDLPTMEAISRIRLSHEPGYVSRMARQAIRTAISIVEKQELTKTVLLTQETPDHV